MREERFLNIVEINKVGPNLHAKCKVISYTAPVDGLSVLAPRNSELYCQHWYSQSCKLTISLTPKEYNFAVVA